MAQGRALRPWRQTQAAPLRSPGALTHKLPGLQFLPLEQGDCCTGFLGLRRLCSGRVWPSPGYIVNVIAAVMVIASLMHTSAHLFIYSDSSLCPKLDPQGPHRAQAGTSSLNAPGLSPQLSLPFLPQPLKDRRSKRLRTPTYGNPNGGS